MFFINIFQKLTKDLSIKQIVIGGVIIMGFVISIFSLTMIYFTSTVKFDKTTLTSIISLEEQNHKIIKNSKIINDLNTKILLSNSIEDLNKIILPKISSNYEHLSINIKTKERYNTKIDTLHLLIKNKLDIQKQLYIKKLNILKNKQQLKQLKLHTLI